MLVLPTAHGSVGKFHYQTHALIPNNTQVKGYRPMRSALGNASFFPGSNSSQKKTPLWQGKTSCEMQTSHTDSLPGKKASFSVFMPRQDTVRTQRNFRPSALKSVSMSLKSSCHFWVKQAQDIPQREADVFISQKMRPII